jgi:hypothetical protein
MSLFPSTSVPLPTEKRNDHEEKRSKSDHRSRGRHLSQAHSSKKDTFLANRIAENKPRQPDLDPTFEQLNLSLSFWLEQRHVLSIGGYEARVIRSVLKSTVSPSKIVSLVYFVYLEDFFDIQAILVPDFDMVITVVVLIDQKFLIYGHEMIRFFASCSPSSLRNVNLHYVAYKRGRRGTYTDYAEQMRMNAISLGEFQMTMSEYHCAELHDGGLKKIGMDQLSTHQSSRMPLELAEGVLSDFCPTKHCIVLPYDLAPSADIAQKYEQAVSRLENDPNIDDERVAIVIPGLFPFRRVTRQFIQLQRLKWATRRNPRGRSSTCANLLPTHLKLSVIHDFISSKADLLSFRYSLICGDRTRICSRTSTSHAGWH